MQARSIPNRHEGGAKEGDDNSSSVDFWHNWLGHASVSKIKHVSILEKIYTILENKVCDSCVKAKHTRFPFPKGSIKTNSCFELIHCDVWGKYRTPTHSGACYFLTIIDDYSRALWVYLLKHKGEAEIYLMSFHNMVKTQFDKKDQKN